MCAVLLPPGGNPIAVNISIHYSPNRPFIGCHVFPGTDNEDWNIKFLANFLIRNFKLLRQRENWVPFSQPPCSCCVVNFKKYIKLIFVFKQLLLRAHTKRQSVAPTADILTTLNRKLLVLQVCLRGAEFWRKILETIQLVHKLFFGKNPQI